VKDIICQCTVTIDYFNMVNRHDTAEFVTWVNSIIDRVDAPEPGATDTTERRREQAF